MESGNGVVSVMITPLTGQPGNQDSILEGKDISFVSSVSRLTLGSNQPLIQLVGVARSSQEKQPGSDADKADHSPPSGAKIKK
jgi:hypothetical protein